QSWTIINAPPAATAAKSERGAGSGSTADSAANTRNATAATRLPVAPWWQRWPKIDTRRRKASYSISFRTVFPVADPILMPHLSAFNLQNVRTTPVLLWALLLAGCGGAKLTSTASTRTTPPTAASAQTTATTTRSQTSTTTATAATATANTTAPNTTTGGITGAVNARIPARFAI